MSSITHIADVRRTPRVLNDGYIRRLREANEAVRQLKALGCRIRRVSICRVALPSEIVVDHNPHRRLIGCESVHVTCGGRP
jgi:hypothetical protein|nr:MAG TPA: hypothetical protein [Caudoviricetes sp.]